MTDGEPETAVSASLQNIKLIKKPTDFFSSIFYFIKSWTSDSFVNHFDGHFAYLKTLDFFFNELGFFSILFLIFYKLLFACFFVSVFHNYVLTACFYHQASSVGYIRHTRIVFTNHRKFVNQVFCLQKCTDLWYSTCSVYKKIDVSPSCFSQCHFVSSCCG